MCAVFSFDFNSFLVLAFNWIEINQIWNGTSKYNNKKHNIYHVYVYLDLPNVMKCVCCFQSGTKNKNNSHFAFALDFKAFRTNYFSVVFIHLFFFSFVCFSSSVFLCLISVETSYERRRCLWTEQLYYI